MSIKLFISPSILNDNLAGSSIPGWRFVSFHHFEYIMSLPSGLQSICRKKSNDGLIGVSLYILSCFSLAAFKILSVSLTFDTLIITCLAVDLFGVLFFGSPWVSWIWMPVSFPRLGKFSVISSSNKISALFSLSSPAGLL